MKKLYEEYKIKGLHYIECTGNKNILIDDKVIVRVLKEGSEEVKVGQTWKDSRGVSFKVITVGSTVSAKSLDNPDMPRMAKPLPLWIKTMTIVKK